MNRLTVQAEDSEVEQLLSHLNIQDEDGIEDSIDLLERTLKWLRAATENAYDIMADPEGGFPDCRSHFPFSNCLSAFS